MHIQLYNMRGCILEKENEEKIHDLEKKNGRSSEYLLEKVSIFKCLFWRRNIC